MVKRKPIKTRGKLKLSRYFQTFDKGARVAVVEESAVQFSFPLRLQGLTGIVLERRGKSYLVQIKDKNKEKQFLIEPIHLKKIK